MQSGLQRVIVAVAMTVPLTAVAIGLSRAPAASRSAIPDSAPSIRHCYALEPCLFYTNFGTGTAIQGTTTASNGGNGVTGFGNNPIASGVYGTNNTGGYGISASTSGSGTSGAGIYGLSLNANPAGLFQVESVDSGVPVMIANNGAGQVAELDDSGNLRVAGEIYTSGSCSIGCSRVRHVAAYTPREALPTIEDVGEARLHAGSAYVPLDPALTNVIDRSAGYAVFVMPEGDNRGLFVKSRGLRGFEIGESQGGRSSISFLYRIIAHPKGAPSIRLPFVVDRSIRGRINLGNP